MPRTIVGWAILAIVVYMIFQAVGAAGAGVAVGHAAHNLVTFLTTALKNL